VARSPGPAWLSPHSVELVTRLQPLPHDAGACRRQRTVASAQPRWDTTKTRVTCWRLHFRYAGKAQALMFDTEEHTRQWADIFKTVGVADGVALLKAHQPAEMMSHDVAEPDAEPAAPPVGVEPAADKPITVREVVEASIDAKNGHAGEGYIEDCRAQAQRHIYDIVVEVKDPRNPRDPGYKIKLGDLPIERFNRQVARAYIYALTKTRRSGRGPMGKGMLGPKTIKDRHGLLSNSMKYAVEEMEIIPTNYCRGIKLPPAQRRRHIYLTDDLQRRIIEGMDPAYRDFVIVLVGTGLRFGEATALRRYSIVTTDYGYEIHVAEAWKNVRKGPQTIGGTKTKKGVREIPVPRETNPELYAAITRLITGRGHDDLIFTSPRGLQVRSGEFHQTYWRLRKRLLAQGWNGRYPTIHDLRPSFAVITLEQLWRGHLQDLSAMTPAGRATYQMVFGDPLNWVRIRLGHRSVVTTQTYLHTLQELEMATRMALVPDGWDLPDQHPDDASAHRPPDEPGDVRDDDRDDDGGLDLDDELDLDGAVLAVGWA
jgi:integrase